MTTTMTANQAYRNYKNEAFSSADGVVLSFKDWWQQQKANGNVDEAGKVILDKFFAPSTPSTGTTGAGTPPVNNAVPPTPPVATKKFPWAATIITVLAVGTIVFFVAKMNKKTVA
jgi:hypothetical protein